MINYEQDNYLMESLFSTFPAILSEAKAPAEALQSLVFAAWPAAVGELVEKRTQPLELCEKRLVVATEDKTWKLHLEDLAGEIIARLNKLCGNGSVAFVEFRVEPEALKAKAKRTSEKGETAEISTELRLAASKIEDANLRRSFVEAAEVYLLRG